MLNRKKILGVTLFELLLTVTIIGILGSIAYPSYVSYITTSNRTEALRELSRLANLQEQYFIDNRTYASNLTKIGGAANPITTESGNYTISVVVENSGTEFTLTATAKGTHATNDVDCTTINIDELGQRTAESSQCWD